MNPSTEILVHISGPSRGPDDKRYRNEARELLNFKPASRHDILSWHEKKQGTQEDAPQEHKQGNDGVTSVRATTVGAKDVLADRLLSRNAQEKGQGATNVHSVHLVPATPVCEDPTVVRKSVPVARQVKKRPISHVLIERTPAVPRPSTTPAPTTPAAGRAAHRRTVSDSWTTPPSVIPDSQPALSFLGRPQISSSPCLQRPFALSSSPSPTRDDNSRNHKRQRVQDGGVEDHDQETVKVAGAKGRLVISSSEEPPRQTRPGPLRVLKVLETYPARPPSSKDKFDSHLTPSLRTISDSLPMQKYFNPVSKFRSAEKFERGHWLVSIHSWNAALRNKFWKFLTKFVEEGRAGWGVLCTREILGDTEHAGVSDAIVDGPIRAELIRFYCWGEVIGEIWVLLFIASERRIQGVGARWVDALQKTVVQME